MYCNGKILPFSRNLNFDVVIYGNKQKGKVTVNSSYDSTRKSWDIEGMRLFTHEHELSVLNM